MTANSQGLVEIRLVDLPLDVYARAQEAHEGLMREFTLIAFSQAPQSSTPARLLQLTDELRERYADFAEVARSQREEAVRRGEDRPELVYRVPAEVGEAARTFDELLDEADEFCRRGDLLTLVPPDEVVAFRRWYLGEFIAQTRGEPPTPWSEYWSRDA